MIKSYDNGFFYNGGKLVSDNGSCAPEVKNAGRENTIAWKIISEHNTSADDVNLKIKFDALASHDITYVGIIQTARASGLREFPVPYVLTNCHNSLCAVGGTINEDDHVFGLSAAKKYGGIFVPAHMAVIHQYMREMMAGCGKMILGSDSHTRYGAIGTLGVGEGGPELVKQLLGRTYDIKRPEVCAIYLTGKPAMGTGPQDVALAIIKEVFANGFVKNRIMEFIGPGVSALSMDYRNGIDVMTTETTCLSSIWATDEKTEKYLTVHGRNNEYKKMEPSEGAYYDRAVFVELDSIKPMIALPFHPSNGFTIDEFNSNAEDILHLPEYESADLSCKLINGKMHVDQAVVAGCSGGTFENITKMAYILNGNSVGKEGLSFSVYPSSQPVYLDLIKNGAITELITAGASVRSAFCGPCFGAGDVPSNNGFSIRHSTRNFPNREGSKPSDGQRASVALMDAMSIAATVKNGGVLTPANEINWDDYKESEYVYDSTVYEKRVYNGFRKADTASELKFGPNIADWPNMKQLPDNLMLKVCSVISDSVTTTDELIPSGETSSYRSNPYKLSEFTLSRKDPLYVATAKEVRDIENGKGRKEFISKFASDVTMTEDNTGIGSVIFARKPGDGSAREQAASCQKVLGGWANIANEYATKRYRSNLINWGMVPFTVSDPDTYKTLSKGDVIVIKDLRDALINKTASIVCDVYDESGKTKNRITLEMPIITDDEKDIILSGCLINYYGEKNKCL